MPLYAHANPVVQRLEDRLQRFADVSYVFVTTENALLRARQRNGEAPERSELGKRFLGLVTEHVNDPLRGVAAPSAVRFVSHVVDPQDLALEVDAARAILRDALPVALDEMTPSEQGLWKIAEAAEEALAILDAAVDAPYAGTAQRRLPFDDV